MNAFPSRCQHIKINGTQCGCPALRRNKLCYFHKRHHEECLELSLDRLKQDQLNLARLKAGQSPLPPITLDLPVLEDANSIQVALMQIMRLIITGQIDTKSAGLLLYALQTASANLSRTTFNPNPHDVILSPAAAHETLIGEHVWEDEDYQEDDEEEEEEGDDEEEDEEDEEEEDDESASTTEAAIQKAAANPPPPKKPPASEPTAQQVRDQIRQALPGLLKSAANRSG
jgi:hypothetical protein